MKPSPHPYATFALLILAVAPLDARAQWLNTNGPAGATATSLTFSGSTLLAGTAGGGVFAASGGYSSWSPANSGLADPDILSLASTVNEFGGEVVVAGTDGGGVFASWNHGTSWSAVSEGLTNSKVPAVIGVADSYFGYGMVLFAGTEGGVFRSNGGFSIIWVPRSGSMTSPLLQAFVTIPGGDENDGIGARDLIAGTDNGAFLSPDGVTWWPKNTGLTNPDVSALAATTTGSGWTLFAATPSGVFRSTSLFGNWVASGEGLPGGTVRTLLGVGSWMFAGTSSDGVFLSTNQGVNWTPVSTGLPDVAVTALASNGVNLFAATTSGVFRRPLSEFDPTTAVDDAATRDAFVGVPRPNPFVTSLAVTYRLDAAGPVRVTVHDTQGRRVAELASGELPSGEHQVRWDGRNESGSAVRAGVYFMRFEAAGRVAKRRVVLSR